MGNEQEFEDGGSVGTGRTLILQPPRQACFAAILKMLFEVFFCVIWGLQSLCTLLKTVFLLFRSRLSFGCMMRLMMRLCDQFCRRSIFYSLLSLFVHLTPEKWVWPAYQCSGYMKPSCKVVAIAVFSGLSVLGCTGGYCTWEREQIVSSRQTCVEVDKTSSGVTGLALLQLTGTPF